MRNENAASRIFDVFNIVFLCFLSMTFLYPVFYVISTSLSSPTAIITGRVYFYPVGLTTSAYRHIFRDTSIISAFVFTVELTVLGTIASLIVTALAAYPLTRKQMKGSGIIMRLIVFTMYFSGGIIPTYMVVRGLGLFNSVWSLILPNAIDTFLLIIMISFFRNLPYELEESAKVDGCSNFGIFLKIFIPLSTAIIATLTVFLSVAYWNTFFNALLYIQDPKRLTLQVKLYQVLNMFSDSLSESAGVSMDVIPENVKGATIVIAVLPIMVIYPFMQKYFIKGVAIGAIKG
ncbi:MAG: carbohydrate ABC transporter permease [Treponema sp.]|jgi:putative aldouronate transport system permease protein|nr:carbohydrate ABC transporter permease [Treponema sp.]